jgi:DNA-binding NarL/FixJ family response regulator
MKPRVLVADDNEVVRKTLRTYLKARGDLELCAESSNGREAVAAALALKPDLLILDVVMPELNGIEVSVVLKNALPEARIILFTMYGDSIGKNLAAAAGVNVILEKADGLAKLVNVLDCFIRASGNLEPPDA